MEVLYTPLDRLDAVWPAARPHIEAGLFYGLGEYEAGDVKDALDDQRMQLWCVVDDSGVHAALVTQIITYPRKRILTLVVAGGSGIEQWNEQTDNAMRQFAAENNCDAFAVKGRPGWARYLRRFGAHHAYTVVTREVAQ